ncbi:phage/plasmid primase, P4 family [Streptomyces sp. NPDC020917]|uniref:DNA primase family protein n=1 Tax=Streptomyces sp. NPDC020917 TaxID=3365102 RepID=UPI0037A68C8B
MNTQPTPVNAPPDRVNGHSIDPAKLRPTAPEPDRDARDAARQDGQESAAEVVPAPTNPMAVARHLTPQWSRDDILTLRHWRGTWMAWAGSHWVELDDQQIRTSLYRHLEHATYLQPATGKVKGLPEDIAGFEERPWAPTGRKVSDLMQAIAAVTHLPPLIDPPAWILPPADPLAAPAARPDATRIGGHGPIVACTNGLLRVADRALTGLTPGFFNLVSVPFDYDPTATAPTWQTFLDRAWPDDPESIEALQEWFGYVLSGRTDRQKILLIVGPTRSGKGTIARVLASLVGQGNMAGPTLASLGSNFGLSTLVGKSLAVISDARLSGNDNSKVVERLLTISGEDTIDVDRKYRAVWTGKLPTRLMILSNELPHFGDSSGVIANRFIVLNMTVSWLGKEDTGLTDKLSAELPGILNWALDGLDRLLANGRLTEPASSREAVTTMQDTASPVSAFVRECCETGPDRQVVVDELWQAWKEWAEDSGHRSGTKQLLGRNLLSIIPQMQRSKPRGADGKQVPTYLGVSLSRDEPDVSRTEPDDSRSPTSLSPALIRDEPDEPRYFEKLPPQQQLIACAVCGHPLAPLRSGQTTHPSCTT